MYVKKFIFSKFAGLQAYSQHNFTNRWIPSQVLFNTVLSLSCPLLPSPCVDSRLPIKFWGVPPCFQHLWETLIYINMNIKIYKHICKNKHKHTHIHICKKLQKENLNINSSTVSANMQVFPYDLLNPNLGGGNFYPPVGFRLITQKQWKL